MVLLHDIAKVTVITVITAESPPITPKSALFRLINELLFNISALPRRRRAKVSDGSPESSSKVCRQKRGRCETIVTVRTVTIVSHLYRFCRQSFELDSRDSSKTFYLLLRERGEIKKKS